MLPEKTLILFDEIQECKDALNALKYFCEDAPEYHIIAAGSLLGVAIDEGNYSFPVGKVNLLQMYPVSFREFVRAADSSLYGHIASLAGKTAPLPLVVFNTIVWCGRGRGRVNTKTPCSGLPRLA